jgi:hypothetical protein
MDRLMRLFQDEELRRWIEEGSMDRRRFGGSDGSKLGRWISWCYCLGMKNYVDGSKKGRWIGDGLREAMDRSWVDGSADSTVWG